jgi:hypothetical protein
MQYEFRTTDGRVCCSGDDVSVLCDTCKERAARQHATGTTDEHDPLASYRPGMKPRTVTRSSSEDVYRNPPDGYKLALERQREEA